MIRRQHIFLTLCMTSIILIIIWVNNDEFMSIVLQNNEWKSIYESNIDLNKGRATQTFCDIPRYMSTMFGTDVSSDMSDWTFTKKLECPKVDFRNFSIPRNRTFFDCDGKYTTVSSAFTNRTDDIFQVSFGSKCLADVIDNCCNKDKLPVPNVVHYVWCKKQTLGFFQFLSFISVLRFINPCLILFHGNALPYGSYWDFFVSVYPNIIHVTRSCPAAGLGHRLEYFEHGSDVMRIEALMYNSELAVVPDSWLEGSHCAVWPPYKSSTRLIKAVIHKEPPTESWKAYPIRVLYKNELYEKVRSKLKRAEVESDLQTETDEQPSQGRSNRRKRSPSRYSSSSEDEMPPQASKKTAKQIPSGLPAPPRNLEIQELTASSITSASQAPPQMPPQASKKPAKQIPSGLPAPPRYLEIQASTASSSFTSASLAPSISVNIPDSLFSQREVPSHDRSTNVQGNATLRVPHTNRAPITPRSQPALPKSPVTLGSGLPSPKSPVTSGLARDVLLFTILEKIREEQRHHTTLLNALFARLGNSESSMQEDDIPEGIHFPIMNKEEMKSFEDNLKDSNSEKLVVNYMASIGGATIENMAYRIFRQTLANSCCQDYNWTGARKKERFESLKLPLLVKRAVRRSLRLVTSSDIEKVAKSFLKSAADRDGVRKRRMKEPVVDNANMCTNNISDSESEGGF